MSSLKDVRMCVCSGLPILLTKLRAISYVDHTTYSIRCPKCRRCIKWDDNDNELHTVAAALVAWNKDVEARYSGIEIILTEGTE